MVEGLAGTVLWRSVVIKASAVSSSHTVYPPDAENSIQLALGVLLYAFCFMPFFFSDLLCYLIPRKPGLADETN